IDIDYYGTATPLKQLATIGVPEARMLTVQPFDPGSIRSIEKAIQESDLGLTPSNDGNMIRLPIPQLTEERRKELVKVVRGLAEVARAVAIIMDGNGRWAAGRGVTVAEGHRAGSRALRPVVETAIDAGVESLVVYAFSTENWARSSDEVSALMEIFGETIDRELHDLAEEGVHTRFVGRRDRAPDWLMDKMEELEHATDAARRLHLWIAFDYGGRDEIVEAARRLAADGGPFDDESFARRLYAPEMP